MICKIWYSQKGLLLVHAQRCITLVAQCNARELGYKLHVAVDAKSELPLVVIATTANDNEKKHAPLLLEKALKVTKGRMKLLVADSQYSSRNLRDQIPLQELRR